MRFDAAKATRRGRSRARGRAAQARGERCEGPRSVSAGEHLRDVTLLCHSHAASSPPVLTYPPASLSSLSPPPTATDTTPPSPLPFSLSRPSPSITPVWRIYKSFNTHTGHNIEECPPHPSALDQIGQFVLPSVDCPSARRPIAINCSITMDWTGFPAFSHRSPITWS